MSAQHTPGPWKTYKDGVHPVLESGSDGNYSFAICQCFGPDALFNQRLIAAAPELLVALKEQVAECFDEACEMCARHEAIIAKAEGRS